MTKIRLDDSCVCVCMCGNLLLKAKTFIAFLLHFSVYLVGYGKIGLNYFFFFQIDLHMFYLVLLQ